MDLAARGKMAKARETKTSSLTGNQVIHGVDVAVAQAKQLAMDARALVNIGSLATAAGLSLLAVEEAGKALLVRDILFGGVPNWKRFWKDYNSHEVKLRAALNFTRLCESVEATVSYARRPFTREALNAVVDERMAAIGILLDIREAALYSDFDALRGEFTGATAPELAIAQGALNLVAAVVDRVEGLLLLDLVMGERSLSQCTYDRFVRLLRREGEDIGNPTAFAEVEAMLAKSIEPAAGGLSEDIPVSHSSPIE